MVVMIPGDAGELEGTLHHAERGVTVAVHDPVRERAVVGANAHGTAKIFAELDEWGKVFADTI